MDFLLDNWSPLLIILMAGLGIWLLMTDRQGPALFCFGSAAIMPKALYLSGIADALNLATGP